MPFNSLSFLVFFPLVCVLAALTNTAVFRAMEREKRMRIRQLVEEGATEDGDLLPTLLDYYRRHLPDGSFVGYLALDGERIVGTGAVSVVEKPAWFGCPTGRIGLISSMYTDKGYRR